MLAWVLVGAEAEAYDHRIAVLVGLGKYEHGRGNGLFSDLPLIANDLDAVATALDAIGFDDIRIYSDLDAPIGSKFSFRKPVYAIEAPTVPVHSLHFEAILDGLINNLDGLNEQDLVLVYFTGHGGTLGKAERVLAMPDSQLGVPKSFAKVQELLAGLVERAPRSDKILVVDACADEIGPSTPFVARLTGEQLPVHLFSSRLTEPSYFDPILKMSVFTAHFVEALRRADDLGYGNADGQLESDEIKDYVARHVPRHDRRVAPKTGRVTDGKPSRVQHPWGSGGQNLILNSTPGSDSR
jgi:hypothetical protein